tara:strand:+ start:553 stop:837 length:285 start_codon:yes stop_codon:yes gene_type:complete
MLAGLFSHPTGRISASHIQQSWPNRFSVRATNNRRSNPPRRAAPFALHHRNRQAKRLFDLLKRNRNILNNIMKPCNGFGLGPMAACALCMVNNT